MLYSQTQVFQISWLLKQFFNLNLTFYKLTKSQQLHKWCLTTTKSQRAQRTVFIIISL